MEKTKYKDIDGMPIFIGSTVSLNLSHFQGNGTVIIKDNLALIDWGEEDYSELEGDHLYCKVENKKDERKDITKICSRCKKELPIVEFAKTAKGLHSTCIHCKMKTKKQRKFKGE